MDVSWVLQTSIAFIHLEETEILQAQSPNRPRIIPEYLSVPYPV